MALSEKQKEYIQNLKRNIENSDARLAYSQIVYQTIKPTYLTLSVFEQFLDTGSDLEALRNYKAQIGRYGVEKMTPGTAHNTQRRSPMITELRVFDRIIAGASRSTWELQSGDVGTTNEIINELSQACVHAVVMEVYKILGSVYNSVDTPDNYLDQTATGITEAGLDTMIDNVLEYSSRVKAILGTRKALQPLYKFAQIREFVLSAGGSGTPDRTAFATPALVEYFNTHRVSSIYGIPIIELPNYRDNALPRLDAKLLDMNKVIVIGDTAGKVAIGNEGSQSYFNYEVQPADWYQHIWYDYGVVIDDPRKIGIIKVSN